MASNLNQRQPSAAANAAKVSLAFIGSGFASTPDHFISPAMDALMVGGISIITAVLLWLFVDSSASTYNLSWTVYYLAFAVNYPHFMASYVMFYWDRRGQLLKVRRYFFAGIIVPAIMLAYIGISIFYRQQVALGYLVNVMFLSVGWHYVKQTYGVIMVTTSKRKYYFSAIESKLLRYGLFPVWFASALAMYRSVQQFNHYGIKYSAFPLPQWLFDISNSLLAVASIIIITMVVRKWRSEKRLPGWTATIAFASIYLWNVPQFYHPHVFYTIAFFHSLQYLLFVYTVKNNQTADEAQNSVTKLMAENPGESSSAPTHDAVKRQHSLRLLNSLVLFLILGYLFFEGLPKALDKAIAYDTSLLGGSFFMFFFITFINIHHYFIDHVIWRKDDPILKKYLH